MAEEAVQEVEVEEQASDEADQTKAEPKAEEPVKAEPLTIPKHRFDSVSSRLKSTTKELEELRAERAADTTPAPASNTVTVESLDAEVAALHLKAAKANADGDTDLYTKYTSEARNIDRRINQYLADSAASKIGTMAVQEAQLSTACDSLIQAYPILDEDNEAFDDDVSSEILEIYNAFKADNSMNLSLADKMRRAVNLVIKDGPASKGTNRAKNLKDAAGIPADLGKTGQDHDKAGNGNKGLNILDMSEKEFDALTEDQKKQMRGDMFG